ncbi:MAG: TonB-dependent receptor [Parvularculaceae bacterium]
MKFAGRLLSGAALGALCVGGAMAQSLSGDEIVVTSQRTEQSLQDVPIAVSAFGSDDLQARQLESFQDIQFNIPNFQFSRSQFTNSSVAIRGVGNFLVAASSEDAVSVHVNDVFISAPRLFETEFFDIERLEILRGPQGTLFGRNATAGVINVITAKANPDQIEGYVDAEYGNYNAMKVQGALNLPLSERLAVRASPAPRSSATVTRRTSLGQSGHRRPRHLRDARLGPLASDGQHDGRLHRQLYARRRQSHALSEAGLRSRSASPAPRLRPERPACSTASTSGDRPSPRTRRRKR